MTNRWEPLIFEPQIAVKAGMGSPAGALHLGTAATAALEDGPPPRAEGPVNLTAALR